MSKNTKTVKYTRKVAKPRASTSVMIRRYESKLLKLKEAQKLQNLRNEVKELQDLIKQGY